MRTWLIVLVLSLSLAAVPTFCGCGNADESAAVTKDENARQVPPKEGDSPAAAADSAEAVRILAQLRGKFPGKTDDEIVQVLRGYVSDDTSAEKNAVNWLAVRLQRAKRQKEAVAAIEKLAGESDGNGVTITYDWEIDARLKPGPPPLRDLLGIDFFADVASVVVNEAESQGPVLDNTWFTDVGLKNLRGFTQLRELNLQDTRITDADLERLKGLTRLESLNLKGTEVTDAGLAHLKGMAKLQSLNLRVTKITDTGLAQLQGLTQIRELNLGWTQVTDTGLDYLKKMTHLRSLKLGETKVTGAAVTYLRQALPNCEISR